MGSGSGIGARRARPRAVIGRLGRFAGTALIAGRWFVVLGWITAAVLAAVVVPGDSGGGGRGDIGSLLPADSEGARVLERSLAKFDVPVLSDTTVVVHNPDGLSALTRADVALWALAHNQASAEGRVPRDGSDIVAAVPLPTATSDVAVTNLYVTEGTGLVRTAELAEEYAAHFDQASVDTYVTGLLPSQVQQYHLLQERLHVFGIATLVLIAVVVAVVFGSLVAPCVVLMAAGLAGIAPCTRRSSPTSLGSRCPTCCAP